MIMSIIIAIVGGIILAVSYLVFEADTIMQIIALLAGWGCLIFAGLCFIYWIFTTLKDKVGGKILVIVPLTITAIQIDIVLLIVQVKVIMIQHQAI